MACFNRNTAQWKAIAAKYKNPVIVDGLITKWQQSANTEDLPTLADIDLFVSKKKKYIPRAKKNVYNGIVNNLITRDLIRVVGNSNVIIGDVKEISRLMGIWNIPSASYNIRVIDNNGYLEIDTNQLPVEIMTSGTHVLDMIDHMAAMFPQLKINVVTEQEARNHYESLPEDVKIEMPFEQMKSYYVDDMVMLVKGTISSETVAEEVLHPFINTVFKTNKKLYNTLLAEAKENYPDIVESVETLYQGNQFNQQDRDLEIVTKALAETFANKFNKETTTGWKQAIFKLLKYLSNIVKDLYKYISGKKLVIPVGKIKSTNTISDIADLLNTGDLEFKYSPEDLKSNKPQFKLTPERENLVKLLLQQTKGKDRQKQRLVLERLSYQSRNSDKRFDNFSATGILNKIASPLVSFQEDGHIYFNADNPNKRYQSVSYRMKGEFQDDLEYKVNREMGQDFDKILTTIILNQNFDKIPKLKHMNEKQARDAWNALQVFIDTYRSQGVIFLPQVVVSSRQKVKGKPEGGKNLEWDGVAGTIDLLAIYPDGTLQVMDLKSSKNPVRSGNQFSKKYETTYPIYKGSVLANVLKDGITTKMQHAIQVNSYKRMLENMGFTVKDTSFTIHMHLQGFDRNNTDAGYTLIPERPTPHHAQDSLGYVNLIAKEHINEDTKIMIEEDMEKAGKSKLTQEEEVLTDEEKSVNDATFAALNQTLRDQRVALVRKREAFLMLQPRIRTTPEFQETLDQIDRGITMISVALFKGTADVTFEQLLKEAIVEIDKMSKYITTPSNVKKPGFITQVINFQKMAETYRGLATIKAAAKPGQNISLTKKQYDLKEELQTKLNAIIGSGTNNPNEKYLIKDATENYMRGIIKTNSLRGDKFTEEEMDALLTLVPDMGSLEYYTGTAATSEDTILALMDKIWKRQKQKVLDTIQARQMRVRRALNKLERLSTGGRVNYDYMLQYDQEGNFTGRYVQKIGYQYWRERYEKRAATFDAAGDKIEYIYGDNLTAEQEEHNIKVYKSRQEYRIFMQAEQLITESDGLTRSLVSGDYHRYSKEFIDAREAHEVFIAEGARGYWQPRTDVTDEQYTAYRQKWYHEIEVDFMSKDWVDGEPTGEVKRGEMEVPKQMVDGKFVVEIREQSSKRTGSRDMMDRKYKEIMAAEPTDELAQAQKEFYIVFDQVYNEMLDKLPQSTRDQMIGKVPLIRDNTIRSITQEGSLFTNLFTKIKDTLGDFFNTTGYTQKVMLDENNRPIDQLPIFYVGDPRSDNALKAIAAKRKELKARWQKGEISDTEYNLEDENLQATASKIRKLPTKNEINRDMGFALLEFISMAENYEVMGELRDTLGTMLNAGKNRQYTPVGAKKLWTWIRGKKVSVGEDADRSTLYRRMKKWMHMVYWENDKKHRSIMDKMSSNLIWLSSVTYVGWNPFGNINNYAIGRISNTIELAGAKFFDRRAYMRAVKHFNQRALLDTVKKLGDSSTWAEFTGGKGQYKEYKPGSKWEAMVNEYRMMDKKSDIRETGGLRQQPGRRSRFMQVLNWGFLLQDGIEYNVQTKVGVAILMSKMVQKREGDTADGKVLDEISIWDSYDYDNVTGKLTRKEGYNWYADDKARTLGITEEGDTRIITKWSDKIRYDIRNYIREANIHMHGNYANEDRMVMQQHWLGNLLAQFHKWVAPMIKARFRAEYFDENLGYLEGRYRTMISYLTHLYKRKAELENNAKAPGFFDHPEKGKMRFQNFQRSVAELSILTSSFIMATILSSLWDDDEDKTAVRIKLENMLIYQLKRQAGELAFFVPVLGFDELYKMIKSPIASTRTLGEMGTAIELTIAWPLGKLAELAVPEYDMKKDKRFYYQKGKKRGRSKLGKEWGDFLPLWYAFNRWSAFDKEQDFFIK